MTADDMRRLWNRQSVELLDGMVVVGVDMTICVIIVVDSCQYVIL